MALVRALCLVPKLINRGSNIATSIFIYNLLLRGTRDCTSRGFRDLDLPPRILDWGLVEVWEASTNLYL